MVLKELRVPFLITGTLLLMGGMVLLVINRARLRAIRASQRRVAHNSFVHAVTTAAAAHAYATPPPPPPPPLLPPLLPPPPARTWAPISSTPRFDPDDLARFKAPPAQADTPCGICLDPFEDNDVTAGQCLHTFHTSCVGAWLAKDAALSCPLCRAPFVDADTAALNAVGMPGVSLPPPFAPMFAPVFAPPVAPPAHTVAASGVARSSLV